MDYEQYLYGREAREAARDAARAGRPRQRRIGSLILGAAVTLAVGVAVLLALTLPGRGKASSTGPFVLSGKADTAPVAMAVVAAGN